MLPCIYIDHAKSDQHGSMHTVWTSTVKPCMYPCIVTWFFSPLVIEYGKQTSIPCFAELLASTCLREPRYSWAWLTHFLTCAVIEITETKHRRSVMAAHKVEIGKANDHALKPAQALHVTKFLHLMLNKYELSNKYCTRLTRHLLRNGVDSSSSWLSLEPPFGFLLGSLQEPVMA